VARIYDGTGQFKREEQLPVITGTRIYNGAGRYLRTEEVVRVRVRPETYGMDVASFDVFDAQNAAMDFARAAYGCEEEDIISVSARPVPGGSWQCEVAWA